MMANVSHYKMVHSIDAPHGQVSVLVQALHSVLRYRYTIYSSIDLHVH